MCRILAL
jgi:hypothetical protein